MQFCPTIVLAESDPKDLEYAINLVENIWQNDLEHTLVPAANEDELLSFLKSKPVDIIFLDLLFPELDQGVNLFRNLSRQYLHAIIIPVIPEGEDAFLKAVLQLDAFFYIKKPYDPAEMEIALTRASEKICHSSLLTNTVIPPGPTSFYGIIGKSPCMMRLFDLIARIAEDDYANVLIRGESGTGKELVAKAIHAHSRRRNKNFVPVNCAAIPDDLLESELFGHTKGAFTGASQNKIGRIQYADGGTLFLDEIGDMKASLQAKLLRVLQEKEFEPVGAVKATPVDTRILAATHCDLEQLVSEGRFREDLYYRLSVIPLVIPPLKSRKEDVPLLLEFFIKEYTNKRKRDSISFSKQVISILTNYQWRGNVRELENLVQHMSILFSGKKIEVNDLPEKFQHALDMKEFTDNTNTGADAPILNALDPLHISELQWHEGRIDFNELINDFEKQLIVQAMRRAGGNKKEAARLLNLKRTTLLEKIKKKELTKLWDE
jgi:DNA-binding NtrC family response regulator